VVKVTAFLDPENQISRHDGGVNWRLMYDVPYSRVNLRSVWHIARHPSVAETGKVGASERSHLPKVSGVDS
jgi:hypothetical protein